MSSYPVLYNKPIDQWKVTELKEELKKRRLPIKGLKDDLIRRLDESLQEEIGITNTSADEGFASDPKTDVQYQDDTKMPGLDEKASVTMSDNKDSELNNDTLQPNVDVDMGLVFQEQVVGGDTNTSKPVMVSETTMESDDQETTVEFDVQETTLDPSVQGTTVETSHEVTTVETVDEVTTGEVTTVETVQEVTTVETSHEATTVVYSPAVSESLITELNSSGQELLNNGAQNISEVSEEANHNSSDLETQVSEVSEVKADSISTHTDLGNEKIEDLNIQPQNEDSNPPHEANLNSFAPETQVFEVSKVTSDSISTEYVKINEKIEFKDNIIADDVKLDFDVKHNREVPSSGNVDLDDGNLQPVDVKEPQENEVKVEETANNTDNPDIAKNNDSGDVEFSEKLNLDRSSGDDSVEEEPLESKQIESKSISDEAGDKREKMEVAVVREDFPVDAMVVDTIPDGKVENKNVTAVASMKRKPHDQETVGNFDTTKRQRRWNSEGLKVLETNDNVSPSITPRGTFQSNAKRNFSKSDSMSSVETPKERIVPPSPKPPTSALRIDRFLRPFTLKAVQELLGKTGTIKNFWMDHIKTHCYVNYSSVEEAIETRNAVYNLQWPANGGRLLVAEFVEPLEVHMRIEAPPSPAALLNTGPVLPAVSVPMQSQPSPRVQVQRQAPQPLPVSLPPPPPAPVSNLPAARERALPPPPPLPERVEPPIVTLDDLFRKTKATPRIYYLPLSDEQVKAKQSAQGKPPSSRA